jgi:hypothetical protein
MLGVPKSAAARIAPERRGPAAGERSMMFDS